MRTLFAPDAPASLLVDVEVVDSSVVGADAADDADDDGDDDSDDDDVDVDDDGDDDDDDEVDDDDPGSGATTTASGLAEDINLYYS